MQGTIVLGMCFVINYKKLIEIDHVEKLALTLSFLFTLFPIKLKGYARKSQKCLTSMHKVVF